MVGDVAHIDKGVKRVRAMRPWLTGGAELGRGVSKLIFRLRDTEGTETTYTKWY